MFWFVSETAFEYSMPTRILVFHCISRGFWYCNHGTILQIEQEPKVKIGKTIRLEIHS